MNLKRKFSKKNLKELKKNGVIVLPNFLDLNIIKKINIEIQPWLRKITFNNIYSSSIIGNNQWISHLGLCSQTVLNIALDTTLISFLEKYFNNKIILAECAFQKKILPEKNAIKWHSDRENGIYIFIFLTPIDKSTGVTRFLQGSHLIKFDNDNKYKVGDGANYIDKILIDNKIDNIVQVYGGSGSAVIFNQNIWHDLPAFTKAGREVLWFKYFPEINNNFAVDHLYRQSFLSKLTKKQMQVYCINKKKNKKKGLTQLGFNTFEAGEHQISNLRMLIYYIRYLFYSLIRGR